MKNVALIGIAVILAGCASPQRVSKKFFEQEHAIAKSCLAPTAHMTVEQRFTVDATTHKAPITGFVDCYSNQVLTVANTMEYARIDLVYSYLGYLERVSRALDEGSINTTAAIESFQKITKSFNQSIATADIQQSAQASQDRRDFADRLAVFASVMAAADRQRAAQAAANRPITCVVTGVYVQNTVVCN